MYAAVWQIVICLVVLCGGKANPGSGLEEILCITVGAIIYKSVSQSKLREDLWYSAIRIVVLIQTVLAVFQYFNLNPIFHLMATVFPISDPGTGQLVGTLGNRDFLASFIAMSIPMFMGWRTVKINIVRPFWMDNVYPWNFSINPALIIIYAVLLLMPSPATLAALVGLFIYYNRGWKFIFIGAGCALIYAIYYILGMGAHIEEFIRLPEQISQFFSVGSIINDPRMADIGRFAMWMTAAGKIISSWTSLIFGFGPGASWGKAYPLHSEYIQVWFEFGMVGILFLAAYLRDAFKDLWREKDMVLFSSLSIICLDMVANFPLHIVTTGCLATIICGLIERKRLCQKVDL